MRSDSALCTEPNPGASEDCCLGVIPTLYAPDARSCPNRSVGVLEQWCLVQIFGSCREDLGLPLSGKVTTPGPMISPEILEWCANRVKRRPTNDLSPALQAFRDSALHSARRFERGGNAGGFGGRRGSFTPVRPRAVRLEQLPGLDSIPTAKERGSNPRSRRAGAMSTALTPLSRRICSGRTGLGRPSRRSHRAVA